VPFLRANDVAVAVHDTLDLYADAERMAAAGPLVGAPLRWRLLLGWHPQGPAAHFADAVFQHATASYLDSLSRNAQYRSWVRDHPGFGAHSDLTPAPYEAAV
jgi:hypothetical protein